MTDRFDLDYPGCIGEAAMKHIEELLKTTDPAHIVEFGGGRSTARLARLFPSVRIDSYEHSVSYLSKTASLIESLDPRPSGVRLHHSPLRLRLFGPGVYFTYGEVKDGGDIDCVIVDGPPTALTLRGREACLYLVYERLREGGLVVLDDYERPEEKRIVKNWLAAYPGSFACREVPLHHGLMILTKKKHVKRRLSLSVFLDNAGVVSRLAARFAKERLRARFPRLVYFGARHYCLFCRWPFRTFMPFGNDVPVFREKGVVGGGYRPDVRCPSCKSLDRERMVVHYLRRAAGVPSKPEVLHVAPEKNLGKWLSRGNPGYVAGDKFEEGYDYDRRSTIRLDLTRLDFADGRFDLVVCNHVLEHVPDDARAMSEIYRVLKPGGLAVLQVPFSAQSEDTDEDPSLTAPEERLERYGQADHVRLYGRDYVRRLEKAGFRVEVVRFDGKTAAFHGWDPREVVFAARRPATKP